MMDLISKVSNLCKPLFSASPIAMYGYQEFHKNGKIVRLSSDKKFAEKYIEGSISAYGSPHLVNMKKFSLCHPRTGFSLWDLEPRPNAGGPDMTSLGYGHVCSFVEKPHDNLIRVHHFAGRFENATTNDFHLNNTNMLRYFCRYIAHELQDTIHKLPPMELLSDQHKLYSNWMEGVGESSEISIPQFLIDYAPHVLLSKRQKELIYWSIMGKTNDEIALILDIKKSTVRKYFERLYEKFQCRSKSEVVTELLKNGFCFADLRSVKHL